MTSCGSSSVSKIECVNNQTWEDGVLKDFAEFEKHGLTHPQIAEIRSLLAAAR
jgi:hypothetical protein